MGWGEGKLCLSSQPHSPGQGPTVLTASACSLPVPGMLGGTAPTCQLHRPTRQVPGKVTLSSRQTQAHPSYFSSPATVVDLFRECDLWMLQDLAVTWKLPATRASPQLSFLRDALILDVLFPGQPVKCLLFMSMPKIPVNIYEPICRGFSYDGKKSAFLLIDAIAHSRI